MPAKIRVTCALTFSHSSLITSPWRRISHLLFRILLEQIYKINSFMPIPSSAIPVLSFLAGAAVVTALISCSFSKNKKRGGKKNDKKQEQNNPSSPSSSSSLPAAALLRVPPHNQRYYAWDADTHSSVFDNQDYYDQGTITAPNSNDSSVAPKEKREQLEFLAAMTFANGGLRAPTCVCCQ